MLVKHPVRFAMIGGGEGAFIGPVHRIAAAIAGNCELVAGALSSDPQRAKRSGEAIGLAPERSYASFAALLEGERRRPDGAEFVAIVTPNHVHAPAAIAALEAHYPVLCDKPLTDTLDAALEIARVAERTGGLVGVTLTYTGYPMVRQARELVAGGRYGMVRRVAVKYTQGWLAKAEDGVGKQAEWRIDPKRSGLAGAFGDTGTHVFNLVEYITGKRTSPISAEIRAAVEGRQLDDDGAAVFHLANGARGTLVASQICTGDANALEISIWCEEAGLHWRPEQPNSLRVSPRGEPEQIWTPGVDRAYLGTAAMGVTRTPSGLPRAISKPLPTYIVISPTPCAAMCRFSLATPAWQTELRECALSRPLTTAALRALRGSTFREMQHEGPRDIPCAVRRRRGTVQQPREHGRTGRGHGL